MPISDKVYLQWIEQFRTAKGRDYYRLKDAITINRGKQWLEEFDEYMASKKGNPSMADLCHCFAKTHLPRHRFAVYMDYLENNKVLPIGTYDHMKRRGFKITHAMKELGYGDDEAFVYTWYCEGCGCVDPHIHWYSEDGYEYDEYYADFLARIGEGQVNSST